MFLERQFLCDSAEEFDEWDEKEAEEEGDKEGLEGECGIDGANGLNGRGGSFFGGAVAFGLSSVMCVVGGAVASG